MAGTLLTVALIIMGALDFAQAYSHIKKGNSGMAFVMMLLGFVLILIAILRMKGLM